MIHHSLPLSMLKVSGQEGEHTIYDGTQLYLLHAENIKLRSIVRVLKITYDINAGLLSITMSNGSVKTLSGFLTDADIINLCIGRIGDTGAAGIAGQSALGGRAGGIGPSGCVGVRGDPGPKGKVGAQGIRGAIGGSGPQGSRGDAGIKGFLGMIGAIGNEGPAGYIGATGIAGNRGSKGIIGDDGPIGDTGNRGCIGEIGPDGQKGSQGYSGAQGPTGSAGFSYSGGGGAKGDTGISGKIINIIGGQNMTATWVDDGAGHLVNIRLSAVCAPCSTPAETTRPVTTIAAITTPVPATTTTAPTVPVTTTTTPVPPCSITISDQNQNAIIDGDYDIYINGVYACAMPGDVDPSTSYTTAMPAGPVVLTFKHTAYNSHGTLKQLRVVNGMGESTVYTLIGEFSVPLGEFDSNMTISFMNSCP
jgi:hypothetical protein